MEQTIYDSIKDLKTQGFSFEEIGAKLGKKPGTCATYFYSLKPEREKRKINRKTTEEKVQIAKEYAHAPYGTKGDVADKHNVSVTVILNWLKQYENGSLDTESTFDKEKSNVIQLTIPLEVDETDDADSEVSQGMDLLVETEKNTYSDIRVEQIVETKNEGEEILTDRQKMFFKADILNEVLAYKGEHFEDFVRDEYIKALQKIAESVREDTNIPSFKESEEDDTIVINVESMPDLNQSDYDTVPKVRSDELSTIVFEERLKEYNAIKAQFDMVGDSAKLIAVSSENENFVLNITNIKFSYTSPYGLMFETNGFDTVHESSIWVHLYDLEGHETDEPQWEIQLTSNTN